MVKKPTIWLFHATALREHLHMNILRTTPTRPHTHTHIYIIYNIYRNTPRAIYLCIYPEREVKVWRGK